MGAGQCPGVGKLMTNTNSLPRVVTYDPRLRSLLFFPVEEMNDLRGKAVVDVTRRKISGSWSVGALGPDVMRQSETRLSFAMPMSATQIGVSVMTGFDAKGNKFGLDLFIDFAPNENNADTWVVTAGFNASSMACPNKTKSGPGVPSHIACPVSSLPLHLKKTDRTLDIAVWVDNLVVEAYFMEGRSPWTIAVPCAALAPGARGVDVFSRGSEAELLSGKIWEVNSLTYEDVELNTNTVVLV